MELIAEPGTIEQLVADAAAAGHRVSRRLIRDWSELGLLDYPTRRPAGKGHGSRAALYSANQRNLFLNLLHHRPTNNIKSLARIPVGVWLYWGDEYVPTSQTRRALNTWLGDPRSSRRQARQTAAEVLRQLDNPAATEVARRELVEALSEIAYTGKANPERLQRAIREVFEPNAGRIHKAVGHPAVPIMSNILPNLIQARLAAIARLQDKANQITDEELHQARHAHLITFAEYALEQPTLAASHPLLYGPVTAQSALNSSCGNLLTVLGMTILYPQRAAAISAMPVPRITFVTSAQP